MLRLHPTLAVHLPWKMSCRRRSSPGSMRGWQAMSSIRVRRAAPRAAPGWPSEATTAELVAHKRARLRCNMLQVGATRLFRVDHFGPSICRYSPAPEPAVAEDAQPAPVPGCPAWSSSALRRRPRRETSSGRPRLPANSAFAAGAPPAGRSCAPCCCPVQGTLQGQEAQAVGEAGTAEQLVGHLRHQVMAAAPSGRCCTNGAHAPRRTAAARRRPAAPLSRTSNSRANPTHAGPPHKAGACGRALVVQPRPGRSRLFQPVAGVPHRLSAARSHTAGAGRHPEDGDRKSAPGCPAPRRR